ncbi:MAG: protein translocase subunit SecD [Porticoccaceae bacterium]
MNRNSFWRYFIVIAALIFSLVYASPNLFAPDPAIQVTGQSSAQAIGEQVLAEVKAALDESGIDYFGEEVAQGNVLVRLRHADDQLKVQTLLQDSLGPDYVVALNLAPTTPDWLLAIGAEPMKLGLDLSGGVHFLMQVDTEKVIANYLETQEAELKRALREARARYREVKIEDAGITIAFADEASRAAAVDVVRADFRDLNRELRRDGEQYVLRLTVLDSLIKEKEDYAVSQNLTTLRNRINELGVAEPIVQRQGRNRIVVELPGIQDTAAAKRVIGKTANLEFRLEYMPGSDLAREEFPFRDESAGPRTAWLEKNVVITGDQVAHAATGYDENGQPQVNISLDSDGGRAMNLATRRSIGRNLGVLFIETRTRVEEVRHEDGTVEMVPVQYESKEIISLATVRSALGVSFRITGLSNPGEASELALLLRAGALAAPMYFVQESTIGPSLGAENITMGIASVQLGLILVMIFMLVVYKVFGVIANLALLFNLAMIVAVMSVLGATLTLPGIAGIVLTLGVAVDANVLINARIREELNNGLSPSAAINAGYDRAYVAIVDANLTTLIVAVILYGIGSGPVQGFAVVLAIGVLTSMFSAIVGTRLLVNLIYGRRNVEKLWI